MNFNEITTLARIQCIHDNCYYRSELDRSGSNGGK